MLCIAWLWLVASKIMDVFTRSYTVIFLGRVPKFAYSKL